MLKGGLPTATAESAEIDIAVRSAQGNLNGLNTQIQAALLSLEVMSTEYGDKKRMMAALATDFV